MIRLPSLHNISTDQQITHSLFNVGKREVREGHLSLFNSRTELCVKTFRESTLSLVKEPQEELFGKEKWILGRCDERCLGPALDDSPVSVVFCKNRYLNVMKLLLDSGADPLACQGKCMDWACYRGIAHMMCATTIAIYFKVLYRIFGYSRNPSRCRR